MTHQQLHSLKDFAKLSTDERFIILVNTLRRQQPTSSTGEVHNVLRDAGKGEGWHECLNRMEDLLTPPSAPKDDKPKPPAYSPSNRGGIDANNIS